MYYSEGEQISSEDLKKAIVLATGVCRLSKHGYTYLIRNGCVFSIKQHQKLTDGRQYMLRAEAKKLGYQSTYYGKPCDYHHPSAQRYVTSGSCVKCITEHTKAKRKDKKDK